VLVHPSSIDLSSRTLRRLSRQLAAHQREIGARWRRLPVGRQAALLALAHLRCGDTYAQLAAGFEIGIATVYRYVREAVEVLTAHAQALAQAMTTVRAKVYVILGGTLLPIDRPAHALPLGCPLCPGGGVGRCEGLDRGDGLVEDRVVEACEGDGESGEPRCEDLALVLGADRQSLLELGDDLFRRAAARLVRGLGGAHALFSIVITGFLVSILPLVAAFLLLQRYWKGGLATGAVKD